MIQQIVKTSKGTWKELLKGVSSLLFIALAAQISLNISGSAVPITGQSLAVLVIACWLGAVRGTAVAVAYLCLGSLGVPVFADGVSGIGKLTGPGGGYLGGFLIAAFLVGLLAEKSVSNSFLAQIGLMVFGTAVILLCGWVRLSCKLSAEAAFSAGILPYLPGALVKTFIGALLVWGGERYFSKA